MTSQQTTLGEGSATAEELAEGQREISIAEFFEKNKHMLGFDSGARGLVTAVKEAVDNALDATEEAGFRPDIYVEIREVGDYYRLVIEDNGPGITKEQLPKVFGKLLYGSRFHAREQSLTPDQRLLVRRNGEIEFLPIGVICDAYLPEDGAATARVPDDIDVPSFTRDDHQLTWQSLTHAIRHETDERTYEISTERGRSVEVTGNHSVFGVTSRGETEELKAGELEPGDHILAPRRLPRAGEAVEEVNLLDYITPEQVEDRRLYVSGFDREQLEQLKTGEIVRKKPSPDSDRKRSYYRYDGVEILKDSLETNYLEKGYLPAEKVLELGWEGIAADCTFRTYQVGGDETTMPISVPVDDSFLELLAHYISEGHVGDRQVGFTFGSHESALIGATEQAVAAVTGSSTTVERERSSTRVEAFGSPLAMFLGSACGITSTEKRVPNFVFGLPAEQQKTFIAALYQGDGSESHPSTELSHTTTSESLARQLSALWNMQGVVATTETIENPTGYADDPSTVYRTTVFGEDVELAGVFSREMDTSQQGYKRVPTALLDDIRVGPANAKTVPDTVPGLLMGAGIGSSLDHATEYQSLIEDALDGEYAEGPRYVHNLKEKGLLDEDHQPTTELEALWESIQQLQGLTESDMCLLEVTDVTETEPPGYVYDVSVPGANGDDENFVVANEGALSVKNSRGQQGIGISAAVLYSQLTSGKPAKITSRTEGSTEAQYFELIIDTDTNEPEIKRENTTTWDRSHGTRIELEMEANMRARQQLHDYIKHTAVVNPHARIELREPGMAEPLKFERGTDQLPAETKEIRPHPHGVELGTLIKMLSATDSYSVSGFMQNEFTRVGKKTADSVLNEFRDLYFGRELGWPADTEAADAIEAAIRDAVTNKGAEATDAFADRVVNSLSSRERTTYSHLVDIVDTVADEVGNETGKTFGATVRENAVEAAWTELTAFDRENERDRLTTTLYSLVDDATSKRKDDAAVHGLAERLAEGLAAGGDEELPNRMRLTHSEINTLIDEKADATEEYDDETFGETARENIVEELWRRMETVPDDPPDVKAVAGSRDTASKLLTAMRETDILSPPTDCLAPITAELVEAGLRKEYDADFYSAATRDAEVHGGDPFVVEAGIAYGGELEAGGPIDLMRFANRVPLVYQRGACAITDVVKQIGWRNYGLDQPGGSGMPSGPAVLMVHVASTNVPFTSESKDALANIPEIEDEIELAIREAARELKSYLNKRRSMAKRREKQDVLGRILPQMAEKVAQVTGRQYPDIDGAMARIMNNVGVDRVRDGDSVKLTVENHSDRNETPDITEIVTAKPGDVPAEATAIEMDDEWFIKWSPTVESGETETLSYSLSTDADASVNVDGVDDEKLTVNA